MKKASEMIQIEYVQFETSKLLKEAGFPQDERMKAYDNDGWMFAHGDECDGEFFTTPTQAQAMRWLREWKRQLISIFPSPYSQFNGEYMADHQIIHNGYPWTHDCYRGDTYEAAAEAGIQSACKYLIEKGGEE